MGMLLVQQVSCSCFSLASSTDHTPQPPTAPPQPLPGLVGNGAPEDRHPGRDDVFACCGVPVWTMDRWWVFQGIGEFIRIKWGVSANSFVSGTFVSFLVEVSLPAQEVRSLIESPIAPGRRDFQWTARVRS